VGHIVKPSVVRTGNLLLRREESSSAPARVEGNRHDVSAQSMALSGREQMAKRFLPSWIMNVQNGSLELRAPAENLASAKRQTSVEKMASLADDSNKGASGEDTVARGGEDTRARGGGNTGAVSGEETGAGLGEECAANSTPLDSRGFLYFFHGRTGRM